MEIFDFDSQNETPAGKSRTAAGVLQPLRKLFLLVEISLLTISLAWASTRLPSAVRSSGEIFRQILTFAAGHLAVFILGNAIVITLLVKSRRRPDDDADEAGLFLDLVGGGGGGGTPPTAAPVEVVYEDKRTILEVRGVHRRSKSEKCSGTEEGGRGRLLRRSETAERRRGAAEVVEELSGEEFRRAIEAFIAKQVKFHQEEKVAIVLHG
ncbi:cytochrome c oxidase subunit 2 [Striga asiatica]|uniref:Cytochrome c oxidase subunit 2 n=1 Tax=Striga asiatica TaxID=4170 RepID=A0A5A7P5C5_STRAF|nr:cytochrome c oxidase subunit 2 [Striga asiatica]